MRGSIMIMMGVVSLLILSPDVGSGPWEPSSLMRAVLAIWVTPGGTGSTTVTAKVAEPLAPGATETMVVVQVSPGPPTPEQVHVVGRLSVALKVVLAGTVSVITTPVAVIGLTLL
jgi:hypothetical protein